MKKKLVCLLALCWLAQWVGAQNPKWVEKAKQAVFSVVTYDKDGRRLNTGNGFFVTADGVALSDYSLFKGAQRAVAIDCEGKQMPVRCIMGADDMYDVVKFRVDIISKKVDFLPLATAQPMPGAVVYLLPYATQKDRTCTQGRVKAADKMEGGYAYYTLDMSLRDKMVSCPVADAEGTVIGLAQKSSGQDTASICYAVDARYAMSRAITALSYNDDALASIGIKKALPDTEDDALVFLYMASIQLPAAKYEQVLNDYIDQYPRSADGYLRRAQQRIAQAQDDATLQLVEEDLDRALDVAEKKDDIHYNRAKMIYNYLLTVPPTPRQGWTADDALEEIRQAMELQPQPLYKQMEGDLFYFKRDYASALTAYDEVNRSPLASPVSFFSAAQAKKMLQAPAQEVVALMDSCVAHCQRPYTEAAAPYLLARAQELVDVGEARRAMQDYDAYFDAMNGQVNATFYYYREQAAMQSHQYQRALDDMAKAIELNPQEMLYRGELAAVNIRVGRSEEAVKVLQEALKVQADYAEGYRLMGLAYVQLKKMDEARAAFAKAKELGDPNVDALIEKYGK